jgi:hypothetical protein
MFDLTPWLPSIITAIVVALIGGFYGWRKYRTRFTQSVPPTWPEVWTRLDEQDKKIAALVSVLETVADEWPSNVKGPVFDPKDLLILQDAVPRKWRAI